MLCCDGDLITRVTHTDSPLGAFLLSAPAQPRAAPIILLYMYNDNKGLFYSVSEMAT